MKTVNYLHSSQFTGKRPYSDVVLYGPTGLTTAYKSLVDTGADYAQFPAAAASLVDLLLSGPPLPVHTASGIASMTLIKDVSLDVEGISITADVLFHPDPNSRPLLGRQALLRAVEAGFNRKEWLWTALPSPVRHQHFRDFGDSTGSHFDDENEDIRIRLLRRIKQLGVSDPNVDLFLAILTSDIQLLRSSLQAGADPNLPFGELLKLSHMTCHQDADYQHLLTQFLATDLGSTQ